MNKVSPSALAIWCGFLGLTAAFGCSSSNMNGTLFGTEVGPAASVIYHDYEYDTGFQDGLNDSARAGVDLYITTMPDACDLWYELYYAWSTDADQYCANLGEIANDHLGEDRYWTLYLHAGSSGNDIVHDYGDLDSSGSEYVSGEAWELDVEAWYDHDACIETIVPGSSYDSLDIHNEWTRAASLRISEHDPHETIVGAYNAEPGPDDDHVRGKFTADYCSDLLIPFKQ